MTRRTLAACLVASLAMSGLASVTSPAAGVAGFGDVEANTFYAEAVQWMVDNEYTLSLHDALPINRKSVV